MKHQLKIITSVLLIIALFLSVAACSDNSSQDKADDNNNKPTEKTTETVKPTEAYREPTEFPVLQTTYGKSMVSDGKWIYFSRHSREYWYTASNEGDGLYRADLSMEHVEKLHDGYCAYLSLYQDKLYYYHEIVDQKEDRGIYCYDPADGSIKRVVNDEGAGTVIAPYKDRLYYVSNVCFCSSKIGAEKPDPDEIMTIGYPEEAIPGKEGIIFYTAYIDGPLDSLCYYDIEKKDSEKMADLVRELFAVSGDTVYYLTPSDPKEGDSYRHKALRETECDLMKITIGGKPEPTGISGKFSEGVCIYGDYIFYCRYVEDEKDESGETIHSKPFCYNIADGSEQNLDNDAFNGLDMKLLDASAGYLYFDTFDDLYFTDDGYDLSSFSGGLFSSLNDPAKVKLLADELIAADHAEDETTAASEPASEKPTEKPAQAAEKDEVDEMLKFYEKHMNRMVKNGEPLGDEVLDTVFEYNFIQSQYLNTVEKQLDSVNSYLLGIFTSDGFKSKYGDDPYESITSTGYKNVELSDLKLSQNAKYYNMPDIEELRSYDIVVYMSDGTRKNLWTSEVWTFAKVGKKWYLVFADSDLS